MAFVMILGRTTPRNVLFNPIFRIMEYTGSSLDSKGTIMFERITSRMRLLPGNLPLEITKPATVDVITLRDTLKITIMMVFFR